MAVYSVTLGDVVPAAGAEMLSGTAGEDIDAGEAVYRDATNQVMLAKNLTAVECNCKGVAVNTAATGQPCRYVWSGEVAMGTVTGAAAGIPVFVSSTAGKFEPLADLSTGDFVTLGGIWKDTGTLIVGPFAAGVQKP